MMSGNFISADNIKNAKGSRQAHGHGHRQQAQRRHKRLASHQPSAQLNQPGKSQGVNIQPKRPAIQLDVTELQIKKNRMRQFGLTRKLAQMPEAGSVVGRMILTGKLSHSQYEVALRWLNLHNYHQYICMSLCLREAQLKYDLRISTTLPSEELSEKEAKWQAEYIAARNIAKQAHPFALLAIETMIERDEDHPRLSRTAKNRS